MKSVLGAWWRWVALAVILAVAAVTASCTKLLGIDEDYQPFGGSGGATTGGNGGTRTGGSGGTSTSSGGSGGADCGICTAMDQCHLPGECDSATGLCSNPSKPDGETCDDGDACTQTDTCKGGVCSGVAYTCTPTICQLTSTCDGNGGCTIVNKDSNTLCPDDDPCTVDTCDGSGTCSHATMSDGTSCGAGLVCNVGSCASGCFVSSTFYAPNTTNPANPCEVCTPLSSISAWSPKADGTAACVLGAVCGAGACVYDPIAYIKASNTDAGDLFGASVALSVDGNTLAVGAYLEESNATGINGNQVDNSAFNSGAVYVFTRSAGVWLQQAYLKASNTGAGDAFGERVALSGDGNTLAVGANGEGSSATGINGNQADNSAGQAGAIYLFTRSGGAWSQQAYIKASNTGAGDIFGGSVVLSSDGNTLAVGASVEGSSATGVNGNQADNSASSAGAAYIFARSGGVWSQQAYVKASNTGVGDRFGWSVALSSDGNTLAVGAIGEGSIATGINGDQADNSANGAGAVYVFMRSGAVWSQQAYIKASNTGANDGFSRSIVLAGDGNTLAVGANGESSSATGINGDQADDSASQAGAVYVFARSGGVWSQEAYVKASNTGASDMFGQSVALSSDGSTLVVGARGEDSGATGINGDQADDSASNAGAVYVLTRNGGVWSQQVYVKASNTGADDRFGWAVALSGDSTTLAVGAHLEDSGATGFDGNESDNSAFSAGAVYVY